MEEKIDRNALSEYVSGKRVSKDKKEIENIFTDENNKNELRGILKSDWLDLCRDENLKQHDLDHIYYKIFYRISRQNPIRTKMRLVMIWRAYAKIAAALLFPLAMAYSIYQQEDIKQIDREVSYAEIHAPPGSRIRFNLPDGSSGWLNSGSTLKYPVRFGNTRNVSLSGEAYFNVKKNDKPFNVKASDLTISVLGTKFNVSAYRDDKLVDVVLESGKVALNYPESKRTIEMKPNERVIYKRGEKITLKKSKVNPMKYSSWKNGKLVFRNESIEEVVKKLSRWYNLDVVLRGASKADFSLRATFEDEEIEEVMRLLKLTFPLDYKIEKRRKDAEGKFARKKIIITVK